MAINRLEQQIATWLSPGAQPPAIAQVDELLARYPYFTLPSVLWLNAHASAPDTPQTLPMRRHIALNTPDHQALRTVLDPDDKEFAAFYPPLQPAPVPTTTDTIDKFISTYGNADPNEEAVLMRMIFNPTPDYAQVLAAQEQRSAPEPDDAPLGSHDKLINDFILKARAVPPQTEDVSEPISTGHAPLPDDSVQQTAPAADDSMLTESLAKMYIGQRRYAKAYEIISNLNLNFPEKSIYFADQLRFLQKLMIAQKYAKPTENDN